MEGLLIVMTVESVGVCIVEPLNSATNQQLKENIYALKCLQTSQYESLICGTVPNKLMNNTYLTSQPNHPDAICWSC